MERKYGSRYDESLAVKDIAAIVRKEIKAAVKSGVLPAGLTASVRTRGGRGPVVEVELAFPGMFEVHTVKEGEAGNRFRWCVVGERVLQRTDLAETVVDWVKGLLHSFNFDGSDPYTDYHDKNFYSHVKLSPDYGALPLGSVVGWSDEFTTVFNKMREGRSVGEAVELVENILHRPEGSEPVSAPVEPAPEELAQEAPVASGFSVVSAGEVRETSRVVRTEQDLVIATPAGVEFSARYVWDTYNGVEVFSVGDTSDEVEDFLTELNNDASALACLVEAVAA